METTVEAITLTENAASKITELLQEENDPNLKIRCFVQGGGCSGFSYGFDFDEDVNDDDFITEQHGAKMVIDSMSYQYLVGATIDYKEDVMGASFVINNPNATTTCGCGSSFSV
jgi:iron-sulfur cluster insertion protein